MPPEGYYELSPAVAVISARGENVEGALRNLASAFNVDPVELLSAIGIGTDIDEDTQLECWMDDETVLE
jgi:hypothetical protein